MRRGNDGVAASDGAFRRLFDTHADYVMKSLRRLGVRPGDVEDLTHEVFFAVLTRWSAYDADRPPRPWLFAFALRVASAYRQSAYIRRVTFEGEGAEPVRAHTAEHLFSERQEVQLVYRALDTLDDDKRIVFTMFELDERTAADIAAELGISQNTIFSRLRAAREEFAAAVKRLSLPPGPHMRAETPPRSEQS